MPSTERMSEAEVSLRLAIYLLRHGIAVSDVEVAIDGAQIKTGDDVHFSLEEFLKQNGCARCDKGAGWVGTYALDCPHHIVVHSVPGKGDVFTHTRSGYALRVESKKGTLQRSKSSAEYPLLREALGHLLTLESIGEKEIIAVAVPKSEKFEELAMRWRGAPLIRKLGIRILTVARDGSVSGFEDAEQVVPPDRRGKALASR